MEGIRGPTLLSQALLSRTKNGPNHLTETSEEFDLVTSPGSSRSHTASFRETDSITSLTNSMQAFLMHNSQNESPEHSRSSHSNIRQVHSGGANGAPGRDQRSSVVSPTGSRNRNRLPSFASATAVFESQASLRSPTYNGPHSHGNRPTSPMGHARSASKDEDTGSLGSLQSDRNTFRQRSRSDAPRSSLRLGTARKIYDTTHNTTNHTAPAEAGTSTGESVSPAHSRMSSDAETHTRDGALTRTQDDVIFESPVASSEVLQEQAIAFLPSLRSLAAVLEQTDAPASFYRQHDAQNSEANTSGYNTNSGGDGLPSYDQVEKKQNSSEYWKARGNEAFVRADYTEAIEMFSAGLRLDPTNYALLSNRSACYFETRDTNMALEDAKKVCTLAPLWFKGYLRQGMAYGKMGGLREALQCYEKAAELHTEAVGLEMEDLVIETRHALAEKIWNVSIPKEYATLNFEQAAVHLGECVKLDPFNPAIETGKVALLLTENKFRECANAADSILENLPTEMTALVSKALALAQMKRSRAALESIEEASIGLNTSNGAACAKAHRLLLEAATAVSCEYYQIDYGPGASIQELIVVIGLLQQLLTAEGLLIDRRVRSLVRCSRAVLLLNIGNYQEALIEGNQVLRDNPLWLPAYLAVLVALAKLDRKEEMAEIRERAVKLMKDVYQSDDTQNDGNTPDVTRAKTEAVLGSQNTDTSGNGNHVDSLDANEHDRSTQSVSTKGDTHMHECASMEVKWDVLADPQRHMKYPSGLRVSDCIIPVPGMQVLLPRNICIHGACLGEESVRKGIETCLADH